MKIDQNSWMTKRAWGFKFIQSRFPDVLKLGPNAVDSCYCSVCFIKSFPFSVRLKYGSICEYRLCRGFYPYYKATEELYISFQWYTGNSGSFGLASQRQFPSINIPCFSVLRQTLAPCSFGCLPNV